MADGYMGISDMAYEIVDPDIIERLIIGAAPERKADLARLLTETSARFFLCEDKPDILLQARGKNIEFNHKTMRLFWLLGFAAWKVFVCYSPVVLVTWMTGRRIDGQLIDEDTGFAAAEAAFEDLLYAAKCLKGAVSSEDLEWPAGVPQPQADKTAMTNTQDHAAFDLTCIGTAYALLHELRHAQFAHEDQRPDDWAEEEILCDVFARDFIMSKAGVYASETNQPYDGIVSKRAMGIALGAFIVYEITPHHGHAGTDEYPPIADRLQALISRMQLAPDADFWVFASALLVTALRLRNRTIDLPCDNPEALAERLIEEIRKAVR